MVKVNDGQIIMNHVKGEEQLADIFTKPLGRINFLKLMNEILHYQMQQQDAMLNNVKKIQG